MMRALDHREQCCSHPGIISPAEHRQIWQFVRESDVGSLDGLFQIIVFRNYDPIWDVGTILESVHTGGKNILHEALDGPYPEKILEYSLSKYHFSPKTCSNWEERRTAFINSTDTHGRTPFLHACSYRRTDMTKSLNMFKQFGAASLKMHDCKGQFAVHIAMQARYQTTLEWLHRAGFDFTVKTVDGNQRTAAHLAVLGEDREGLRFLNWNARHALMIKGEASGKVSPIELCLERYGRGSPWYSLMYHGLTLKAIGLPVPQMQARF